MTLRLVRDCQVARPSQLNPQLPPGLDELVLKALAPTPDGRYPDCGAFRLAIEDYILQDRLPASNAHLAAFLREVYAERLAREADPANLDQLGEDTDLDAKSNSSHSSVRSQSHQNLPVIPPVSPPSRTGTPVIPPPRKTPVQGVSRPTLSLTPAAPVVRRRRRFPVVPVVAGVGALLIGAGAALVFLRPMSVEPNTPVEPGTPVTAPRQVAEPTPPPAQPTPEPEPQAVTLKVLSEPPGAVVVVDGKQHGETPLDLPLTTNAPPVMLALKLDGYEPVSRPVSAGDAPEVSVKLTPKPATQKPRRPSPSQLGIKTDR
jgi:hypothetical protein